MIVHDPLCQRGFRMGHPDDPILIRAGVKGADNLAHCSGEVHRQTCFVCYFHLVGSCLSCSFAGLRCSDNEHVASRYVIYCSAAVTCLVVQL